MAATIQQLSMAIEQLKYILNGRPGSMIKTVKEKFFIMPRRCAITNEPVWLCKGIEVIFSWNEDNHFSTPCVSKFYFAHANYMIAVLRDNLWSN